MRSITPTRFSEKGDLDMRRATLICAALMIVGSLLVVSRSSSQIVQDGNSPQSRLGIYGVMGFVIVEVDPESAAGQAGLRPGDIVTHLNGQVTGIQEFQNAIWSSKPGTTLSIKYLRFDPATGKFEERETTVKTMPFTSRVQGVQSTVQVASINLELPTQGTCPLGCCATCEGFSPNKRCGVANMFAGFRLCRSNGFECSGIYCA